MHMHALWGGGGRGGGERERYVHALGGGGGRGGRRETENRH